MTVKFFTFSARRIVLSLLPFFAPLALSAPAAAAGMELKTEAFQEVLVKAEDGKQQKKRVPLTTAVPGTEVIYVITYRNSGAAPADNVIVSNPVPENLIFVPGSAQGEATRFEVSIDKGKTYGALEALKVKQSNGSPRPANGGDVTHVRWTVLTQVAPAASGSVSYKALLK